MATILQMEQALINAHVAGDVESARKIASAIKERKAALGENKPNDPTEGMSPLDTTVAGFGKAFMDLYGGGKQLLGLKSRTEVDEDRRLAAPLMNTAGGRAGNVAGNIAAFAPVALIPGVNTVVGAGLAGAGMGAIQPVGENDSRLSNIATGAALNAAFPAGIAALKTAKAAIIDPFRKVGQEAIAGRVLQQFARDPANLRKPIPASVIGTRPTLAEAAGDEGLAQLQRTVMTQHPRAAAEIAARQAENNAIRVNALSDIAGAGGAKDAAEAARTGFANAAYKQAYDAGVDQAMAKALKPQINNLMARPSVRSAIGEAKKLAAEEGVSLGPVGSVKHLHYVKKAIDDMIEKAPQTGIGANKLRALVQTKQDLISVLDDLSPAYKTAREGFQARSVPINQMEVGERLLNSTTSAMRDFSGNPRMHGEAFARALRNEESTVKAATGMNQTLAKVMTPDQMTKLRAIEGELSKAAGWQSAGKVPGSPTAQYLVGQDILKRTAGPLGIPTKFMDWQIVQNAAARPLTWAYKMPEERIMTLLGDAMLDPQLAAGLLRKGTARGPVQQMLDQSPKIRSMLELVAAGVQVAPVGLLGTPAERQ